MREIFLKWTSTDLQIDNSNVIFLYYIHILHMYIFQPLHIKKKKLQNHQSIYYTSIYYTSVHVYTLQT